MGRHADKIAKRTLKYLKVCDNAKACREVIKSAPDSVIKLICNAALNVERNPDIVLTPEQKELFRHHRKAIALLTSPDVPVVKKRVHLVRQSGGFLFLPALLGAVTKMGSVLAPVAAKAAMKAATIAKTVLPMAKAALPHVAKAAAKQAIQSLGTMGPNLQAAPPPPPPLPAASDTVEPDAQELGQQGKGVRELLGQKRYAYYY